MNLIGKPQSKQIISTNSNKLRNVWYLNINSNTGTAIGKCGSKGSNLTDLDITAGFITASQNLSQEMVSSEEVSKYNFENIKGGSKRLILYTTWGKEVSQGPECPFIPTITSMLQVSGPEMEEKVYNNILQFLKAINDEIVYRFMLGELSQERTIDPIIHIDILKTVLARFDDRKKLIGDESKNLERMVKDSLDFIFNNDLEILDWFLSRIPPESTCIQEKYIERMNYLKNSIKEETNNFLNAERKLSKIRKVKIYGDDNSFSYLKDKFRSFQDKQESYFENKRALSMTLENCLLILENLLSKLKDYQVNENVKKLKEISQLLPKLDELDKFLTKISDDLTNKKSSSRLKGLENKLQFNEKDVNRILVKNRIISKENSKNSYQKITLLKQNLQTFISISKNLAKFNQKNRLENLKGMYCYFHQEEIITDQLKDGEIGDKLSKIIKEASNESNTEGGSEPVISSPHYRKTVQDLISEMRTNLVVRVIDSLFVKIFREYQNFKYIIAYPEDFKPLIINETIEHISKFIKKIQDFSFPVVLQKILKKIKAENLIEKYSLKLLNSYLSNYLYESFLENPFIIEDKFPVIALDSYSLKFCSEIIKNTGLNEKIYSIIAQIKLPQRYKESFIQILDSSGLTKEKVALELKNSSDIFKEWMNNFEDLMEKYEVKDFYDIKPRDLLSFCDNYLEEIKDTDKKNIEKGKLFIKEKIFQNLSKDSEEWKNLGELYSNYQELNRILNEFEKIREASKKIFNKGIYQKLVSMVKALIYEKLKKDKSKIGKFIQDISNLVDETKTNKFENLISKVENIKELVKDDRKLSQFENQLKSLVKYEKFESFYQTLESLDNQFLKLKKYTHFRGILKTIVSPKPIVKESSIENKHESYYLILEALIETYSSIYEDYFGSFSFKDIKKLISTELKLTINPGKFFNKKVNRTRFMLNLQIGINFFNDLFKTIHEYEHKFDFVDFYSLFNYLKDYKQEKNFESTELMVGGFQTKKDLNGFFDFIIRKFKEKLMISKLKKQLREIYQKTEDYLKSNKSNVPKFPTELSIINIELIKALKQILKNVDKRTKKYYLHEKHPEKSHPSREYQFEDYSKKDLRNAEEIIDEIEEHLKDDFDYLLKKFSPEERSFMSREELLNLLKNNMKEAFRDLVEKYDLKEYDFRDINKIRIKSILNLREYSLPLDIRIDLIQEGRYNKKTVKTLTKSANKVSNLFRMNINNALAKDPNYKKVLNRKVKKIEGNGVILPMSLQVPPEIKKKNLKKIFGTNSYWVKNNPHKLLGYKLDVQATDRDTYEKVMIKQIRKEINHELNPVISILNRYSQEIHTGFSKVYDKIFE